MDISKHIIDQRIKKIVTENPSWFEKIGDEQQKLSKAFVCLSVSSYLNVELSEAAGYLTEGGNDAGIDAIFIGDFNDFEFPVTIFQGKYVFDLEKDSNFPANSVQKVVSSIASVFDPQKPVLMNKELKPKVEEIRSLISDGYVPTIRCIFTNNGLSWNVEGQQHINNAGYPAEQVQFEHFNHSDIVDLLQTKKDINATIKLAGKSFQEDFNFKRVLIGKVNVTEIATLFENHGDAILERNIRRYLGLNKNRVNEAIKGTILSSKKDNFYFYNNGITMICRKFSHNALQANDWSVKVENLQIINGGQTCKTIQHTLNENPSGDYSQVFVLVRLYELSGDGIDDLINDVTIATNSQSPVDLRDLRANDSIQINLEKDIEVLGYTYKRKKDGSTSGDVIPSSVAAEAIYSIWCKKPHLAKFQRNELFGKFYEEVFKNINGVQLVLAVLIYRFCDNQRKKNDLIDKYPHLPYSHNFMAMIVAQILIKDLGIPYNKLIHTEFIRVKEHFEKNTDSLYERANAIILAGLKKLYTDGYENIELRRLSATFRRGDLMSYLEF
ncbi:MAG: AIPR family protein [Bacteroidetes bacterium]|nr:AIPR family protein [Bacteroidota bacterium]